MKKLNLLLMVVAVIAIIACGKKSGSGSKQGIEVQDSAGQTVANLESKWLEAECKHDTAVLARFMTDDFTFVMPDGSLLTKSQYLKMNADDTTTCLSWENKEYKPRVYGNTVVITGLSTINTKLENGTEQRRYRWTDTWIIGTDGQWRCVAAQSVRLTEM